MDSRVVGEQLETAIYRFVEETGKGLGRSSDIGTIASLVPGADHVDAVDALLRLYEKRFISLAKYSGKQPAPLPYSFFVENHLGNEKFFYEGEIHITITPGGRLDMERGLAALETARGSSTARGRLLQLQEAFLKQEELWRVQVGEVPLPASLPVVRLFKELKSVLPSVPKFDGYANALVIRTHIADALSKIQEALGPPPPIPDLPTSTWSEAA